MRPQGLTTAKTVAQLTETHGLTKKKGLAGRYLDLTITARATRS
jgi:hypothetical protein